jgi:hypothetical protein
MEDASVSVQPPSDLRSVSELWRYRQHQNLLIVCLDDPAEFEAARAELAALDTELITETEPGPLSRLLGRPTVCVCDRFLDVELCADYLSLASVLDELRRIEYLCPECPQAGAELH